MAEALAALHCNGHVKLLQNLDDIFPSFEARFTDQHRLGAGNCSETFRMYDKVRGKWVFSKQLDVESGTWEREICALKSLKHPNIVTLLEDPFILDDKIHLICECMDADLRTYIRRIMPDSMSSGFLKGGLLDLLHAVSHLHHLGWIHRDLKPQNILVDLQNRCLKVADFGLSSMHHQFRRQPLTQEVVTLWYRAPELMLGGPYDKSIDIWSVGCIYVATSIVKAFKNQLCYFNVPTEAELLGMLEGTRTQARSDVQITLCFSGNFVFLLRSPQAIPSLGSALACLSLSIMPG